MLTLARHFEQISKNPNINVEEVRKVKYLHEFDRYACMVDPLLSAR